MSWICLIILSSFFDFFMGFLGSIWSCFYKFKLASFIYKVSLFLVWLIHFIRLMIQILYFFMGFIGIHMRSLLPQVQKLITKFLFFFFFFNLIFEAMLEILITHDDAYFNFHFFFFSSCDLLKLQKIEKKKKKLDVLQILLSDFTNWYFVQIFWVLNLALLDLNQKDSLLFFSLECFFFFFF